MHGSRLRDVPLELGLPKLEDLVAEFDHYRDVLLGRVEPPIDVGVGTLMEVADAYFARACEVDQLIHQGEREGGIFKNSNYYKFRTGELRSFLDLSKRAAELGSRRITLAQMAYAEQRDSGMR